MPKDLRDQFCRTCLTSLSKNHSILETFHIFTTEDLAKKIMLCVPVAVELSDEYPHQVCSECYKQIMLFYDFQQMCVKSLDKFNELLKTPEKLKEYNINIVGENYLEQEELMDAAICGHPLVNKNVKKTATKRKKGRPSKKIADENENLGYVTKKDCNTATTTVEINESPQSNLRNESEVILEVKFATENLNDNAKKAGVINEELICSDSVSDNETNTTQKLPHKCDICNEIFDNKHRLRAHKRQHYGLRLYRCPFEGCELSFIHLQNFNNHVKEHKDADDVENCERIYKNKSTLNEHKRKLHHQGPELKSHMCEICGKVFKLTAILNNHRFIHIDRTQYPFVCKEPGCTQRFSRKESLQTHAMRHAGIKNFICPYCGKRTTTRGELKNHLKYHTLEKTWPCRVCSKVFNSPDNLKMHIKNMHERAKDFGCQFCDRTFAQANTRKYHEMTHTGERPHQCKECGKRFVQPASLRAHTKIHLRKKAKSSKNDCPDINDHKAEQHSKERESSIETEALVSATLSDDC